MTRTREDAGTGAGTDACIETEEGTGEARSSFDWAEQHEMTTTWALIALPPLLSVCVCDENEKE